MKWCNCIVLVILAPLSAQTNPPPTAKERAQWFANSTYSPTSLLVAGPVLAGWRTHRDTPYEWDRTLGGFGQRYGAHLMSSTAINGLEASAGAIWKEDPRYFPVGQGPVRRRIGHALKLTFVSRYDGGNYHFAAARAVGIVGGSFARKLWMPDSVTSFGDSAIRFGTGYSGRLLGNLFLEFGPEIRKLFKRH